MEALFDTPSSSHGCASLADLQQQLRHLLDAKVTPTKAEHLSITFELRSNVTFAVPVTEAENASLEAGGGVDPRLFGGQARASSTVTGVDGQLIRNINALDAVLNQSQDDPLVQRTVAKHVMAGVGDADQSQWVMRSMTRGNHGWTFVYGCKDSAQTWARQNARNPPKVAIGEWSGKDALDPVNLSRPAFDCRGTLTIAFSKSEKAISIKYEHTNMHKTVGELLDILAPPPPRPQPMSLEGRKSATKKTPKKRPAAEGENGDETPDGEAAVTPRPKKRKKSTQDGEQPSTKRKRPRKKQNDDDTQIDPALSTAPPEVPGTQSVGNPLQQPLSNTQQGGAATGGAYPQGPVSSEPFNGSEAQASAMVSSGVHAGSILNLPAGEAERRREAAIRLLTESQVDPKTLSPEQFNIFANQAPSLQQESLKMLVKYGAERLRIVLPNKDGAAADLGETVEQPSAAPVPATTTATAAESPKRKRKATRKKAEADETSAVDLSAALTQTDTAANRQIKLKAPRLSRGVCTPCKASKTKCGKEKPACNHCLAHGIACSYPLQKSRKSKAAEDGEENSPRAGETEQPAELPEAAQNGEDEPDDLPSPGFTYQDPGAPPHQDEVDDDTEPEAAPVQHDTQTTYGAAGSGIYHHASGLTFPDSISPEVTQQIWTSGSGADYNQHASVNNGLSLPRQASPTTTLSHPHRRGTNDTSSSHAGLDQQQKSWGSYTSSQRPGAANTPATTGSAINSSTVTASWPAYSASEALSTNHASVSPRQSRRAAKPNETATYNPNGSDGSLPASAAALAQAAIQTAERTASPVPATHYDAVTIARAKSRQSMKLQQQTRTPVPNQPSRQAQRSDPSTASNNYSTAAADKTAASMSNNNSYSQYSTPATDQSNNGVSYQSYPQQSIGSTTATSYPNFDSYAPRSHNTSNTLPFNNSSSSQVGSYTSSPSATSAAQWGSTSTPQTRNAVSYSNTATAASSVNLRPANPQQRSQIPASFNVRPQAPSHNPSRPTSTATTGYGQTQHSLPQQNSYSSYSQPQQQQRSSSAQQQQGWYTGSTSGYGTAAARANNTISGNGYSSSTSGGAHSHNASSYGQHQQQGDSQHAMNLSGHTYSSMDSEGAGMYNMLPGGSGH